MNKIFLSKNKPLVYASITGIFYFIFTCAVGLDEAIAKLYATCMLFLPGLTFPIATSYLNLQSITDKEQRITVHFIFSAITYHGVVWLFSHGIREELYMTLAGFTGSFFYLFSTKIFLQKKIPFLLILLTSVVSGFSFLPLALYPKPILLGLALLLWTITNGTIINYKQNHFLTPAPE